MTAPTITTATTAYSANQTSHVVNLPSSIAAGDELLLWFNLDATGVSTTITPPAGWTEVAFLSATDRSMLMARTADGSEGSTVTVTSSTSESSTAIAVRASGAAGGIVVGTIDSTGSAALINPLAVTPDSSGDAVWMGFVSATGTGADIASTPGIAGSVFVAGDATGGTVTALAYWGNVGHVVSGVQEPSLCSSLSGSIVKRQVAVLIQGTSSVGGGSSEHSFISIG